MAASAEWKGRLTPVANIGSTESKRISINGNDFPYETVNRLARKHGCAINFVSHPTNFRSWPKRPVAEIRIESFENMGSPYAAVSPNEIWMCQSSANFLSQYFKVDTEWYILLLTLLGVVQLKALQLNEMLEIEDLVHDGKCSCALAKKTSLEEWTKSLETPHLCAGTVDFYNCLGVEFEVGCLTKVLFDLNAITS